MANKFDSDVYTILFLGFLVILICIALYISFKDQFFFDKNELNDHYEDELIEDISDKNNNFQNFNLYEKFINVCTKNIESYTNNNKNTILEFYSMDDCHYCNIFKSVWNKLKQRHDIKSINIKPSDKNYDKMINKYNINEFPYIQKILPNGTAIKYNGERNYNDIVNWYFS